MAKASSATRWPSIRAARRRRWRRPLATAHDDISYVAHLVSGGDRLAAVVNVLRASDNERSIVFVHHPRGGGGPHAALVARGFSAMAISGDRVQAERDRALDQLRPRRGAVLVATNVAARGLHLPDVDLIVHADLPLNAESLTHRSGRTGRAGRKGTAVRDRARGRASQGRAPPGQRSRQAGLDARPSAQAIAAAARERLLQELAAEPEADDSGADDLPATPGRPARSARAGAPPAGPRAGAAAVGRAAGQVPMPAPGTGAAATNGARVGWVDPEANDRHPRDRAPRCRAVAWSSG